MANVLFRNLATGVIGEVPAEHAQEFADDPDYRVASTEELDAERKAAEAGTLTNRAKTVALGAIEGVGGAAQTLVRATDNPWVKGAMLATPLAPIVGAAELTKRGAAGLGMDLTNPGRSLPAQVVGAVGGDEAGYSQDVRTLAEANPNSFAAGGLIGNVGLGLATGGFTMGLQRAATAGLAKAGLGSTAAGIAGTGLAMGAEGGFYGAAEAEQQARLSGKTSGATAEELLQGIGLGALIGGGLGVAGSGAMSAFRKLVTKLENPITRAESIAAVDGVEAPMVNKMAKTQADLTGADYETLAKYGPNVDTPEAIAAQKAFLHRDEIIDSKISGFNRNVQELTDAFETVSEAVRNPVMRKGMVDEIPAVMQPGAARAGKAAIRDARIEAQVLLDSLPEGEYTKAPRSALTRFLDFSKTEFSRIGDSASDVNAAANAIKQEAQRVKKSLATTANSPNANGEVRRWAKETSAEFERKAQEPLRLHLEDENVWGNAGLAQKETNAEWVNLLEAKKLDRFKRELMGEGGLDYDGRPVFYADTAKASSFIGSVGTTAGETRQAVVRDTIDSIDRLASTIAKHHELTPEQAKQLANLKSASTNMRKSLAEIDDTVGKANQLGAVLKAQQSTADVNQFVGGRVAGAVYGAMQAGPEGALFGALGLMGRPATAIAMKEQVRALGDRIGIKLVNTAGASVKDSLIGRVQKGAATVGRGVTRGVERVAPAVRKVVAPTAVSLFTGKHKTPEDAYVAKADQLQRVAADPSLLIQQVSKVTGGLSDIAPDIAGDLVAKATNGAAYLTSKLPSGTIDPNPIEPARKSIVPRSEIVRFARIWAAVERPASVLEDLRRGMATPEQIDALRAVHPETYQAIRERVQDELIAAAQKGLRVPLTTRQQLDLLLGLDGAGVPAMSPAVSDRILALQAKQPEGGAKPKPTGGKPPDLAKSLALPQENWPSA